MYPKLKFIVQDRGPVLQQAKEIVWPKENPSALAEGRVTFVEHDFFQPNPVRDAEVYWLRYILYVASSFCRLFLCGFLAQWLCQEPLFLVPCMRGYYLILLD